MQDWAYDPEVRKVDPAPSEVPGVDVGKVRRLVEGREMAMQVVELLGENAGYKNFMRGLIDGLQKCCGIEDKKTTCAVPARKTIPIARLAATVIPFGQHKNKCFDLVDLKYLDWLCREQESFYKDLRAYLTHPDLDRD